MRPIQTKSAPTDGGGCGDRKLGRYLQKKWKPAKACVNGEGRLWRGSGMLGEVQADCDHDCVRACL